MFTWPPSGQPRTAPDGAFTPAVAATTPPPDTFELIRLTPTEVDRLELTNTPGRRTRWRRQNDWRPEDLNP
jgi:hypothetical protein